MRFFVMDVQYFMINSSELLFAECSWYSCLFNMPALVSFCLPHSLNREGAISCSVSHVNLSDHRIFVSWSYSEKRNWHVAYRLQPILRATWEARHHENQEWTKKWMQSIWFNTLDLRSSLCWEAERFSHNDGRFTFTFLSWLCRAISCGPLKLSVTSMITEISILQMQSAFILEYQCKNQWAL